MNRGFPRPRMHIEKCVTRNDYGAEWDNKTYPVPYTAEEYSISTLHTVRLNECIENDACVACGDPVEDKIVSVMYRDDLIHSESGPFHHKCARLTQKMCPHIAVNPDKWTFKQEVWAEVKPDVLAAAGLEYGHLKS